LPYIIKGLPRQIEALFKRLRWNSIFNLNLGIEKKDYSKRHWIYFPEKDTCFFRVGFFHNFSCDLAPLNKSSLYVEVSYSEDKPIDKTKIILRVKEDLRKTGVLTQEDKILTQDINDIKYGYPVYDRDYKQAREKISKYLMQNNIIACGRYGSWRYMSMEDVVLQGEKIAETINL
jgi:protoporphyrinogen oxidase